MQSMEHHDEGRFVLRSEVLAAVEEWEREQTAKGGGAPAYHESSHERRSTGPEVTSLPAVPTGGVPAWYCPGCKLEVDLGETFGDCPKCSKPMDANTRIDAEFAEEDDGPFQHATMDENGVEHQKANLPIVTHELSRID